MRRKLRKELEEALDKRQVVRRGQTVIVLQVARRHREAHADRLLNVYHARDAIPCVRVELERSRLGRAERAVLRQETGQAAAAWAAVGPE